MKFKLLIGLLSLNLLLVGVTPVAAEPTEPQGPEFPISDLLAKGIQEGVKAGVSSITKEVLTGLGSAVIDSYFPGLGGLLGGFLGGSTGPDENTLAILENLDEMYRMLSAENQELLDVIYDDIDTDLRSTNNTWADWLESYLYDADLIDRMHHASFACRGAIQLNEARHKIQALIESEATTERAQIDRLEMLSIHLAITQLAVTIQGHCKAYGFLQARWIVAGRPGEEAEQWLAEQIERDPSFVLGGEDEFTHWKTQVIYPNVIEFFRRVSAKPYIYDYISAIWTPTVDRNTVFKGDSKYFDKPLVTELDSWGPVGCRGNFCPGGPAPLDGRRYYYHVDVPAERCLTDDAIWTLSRTSRTYDTSPWDQGADEDPMSRPCNRFWLLVPSGLPEAKYLASFNGYTAWFEAEYRAGIPWDPESATWHQTATAVEWHKSMVIAEVIWNLYAPTALVLDHMQAEIDLANGVSSPTPRQRNVWDILIAVGDYRRTVLSLADTGRGGEPINGQLASRPSVDDVLAMGKIVSSRCEVSFLNQLALWAELVGDALSTGSVTCPDEPRLEASRLAALALRHHPPAEFDCQRPQRLLGYVTAAAANRTEIGEAPTIVFGTEADDTLVLAAGDVACGFGGDDAFVLTSAGVAHIDGGPGEDTIDLSSLSSIEDVDVDLASGDLAIDGHASRLRNVERADRAECSHSDLKTLADDCRHTDESIEALSVVAIQACEESIGRHGETIELLGRSYTIHDLQWMIDNGLHSGQPHIDGTLLYQGTDGDDLILGTAGADQLKGLFGNDIICARAGNDKLFGWGPATRMPGDGGDILVGGPGSDTLQGGFGADILIGDDEDFAPGSTPTPHWGHEADDDAFDHCLPYRFGRQHGCDPLRIDSGVPPLDAPPPSTPAGFAARMRHAVRACEAARGHHGQLLFYGGVEYAVVEIGKTAPSDGDRRYYNIPSPDANNIIVGTDGSDVLGGFGGDDIICGEGGDDSLAGNDGDDVLIGGNGTDAFTGNAGVDLLFGDESDLSGPGTPLRGDGGREDGLPDWCTPTVEAKFLHCQQPT